MGKLPEGYTKFTKIEDCYVTGIATIAYMVIEKLFDLIMPTLMAPMCKVQEEGEEKKKAGRTSVAGREEAEGGGDGGGGAAGSGGAQL